jgi:hypothetical protein
VEFVKRLAMDAPDNNDFNPIDHKTSRSICEAVGEHLRRNVRPETALSSRLRQLLEELHHHDNDAH